MKVHIDASPDNKKNILTLLEELGYTLPCNCQGSHRCSGKNYTFDCSMIPSAPLDVDLPSSSQKIRSIALEDLTPRTGPADTLLIDLGTTTIALALIGQENGQLRQTTSFANPQIHYGADVIARIQAASSGAGKDLQRCLKEQLEHEVLLLCRRNHQDPSEIRLCFIGGNTTMIHLMLGYDCSSLGHSPFTIQEKSPAPFWHGSCLVKTAPWISAFVGGDITAGLFSCQMLQPHRTTLFIDLGTNGEMVLSHNETLYATATAAGPALEGSGLSCGCPGIPGAIRKVSLRRLRPALETIDNLLPVGLCGSGAISLCAELVRHRYITNEGILTDRFPADGLLLSHDSQGRPLRFTASDLRNVQLAIAAIAAGIDTLLDEAKLRPSEIERLYLGGGFGFFLSLEDCETLGLFSRIPISRIEPLGNTCLRGLYQWASTGETLAIPAKCISLNLADRPCFQEQFVHHMAFPTPPVNGSN